MSSADKVQPHGLVKKLSGLVSGKPQVGGTQLGQLTPRAEPGEWQLGILTGGDDQVHVRWEVVEQKGEGASIGPASITW